MYCITLNLLKSKTPKFIQFFLEDVSQKRGQTYLAVVGDVVGLFFNIGQAIAAVIAVIRHGR